ncbi:RHS repeat-associated core domain-containing protein [Pseudomonas putida]|uniref:RHS repeat-associated core domain-containing protein n=1 Tax=Pseudomonas putida TaxID=303 RepID=UPI0035717A01
MAGTVSDTQSNAVSLHAGQGAALNERIRHFYQGKQLATEIAVDRTRHILLTQDVVLAQLEQGNTAQMLRVNQANSVLGTATDPMTYSAYGYLEASPLATLLAFNGQRLDLTLQGYMLGNGYRIYSPCLRRFHSPDALSPFAEGGLNAFSYCEGDPVNKLDPSGHFSLFKPRTWFRSKSAKIAQRKVKLENWSNYLGSQREYVIALDDIYNIDQDYASRETLRAARTNLYALTSESLKKIKKFEGKEDYFYEYLDYRSEIRASIKVLGRTVIEDYKKFYKPETSATTPRGGYWGVGRKRRENPYTNVDSVDAQSRIRQS